MAKEKPSITSKKHIARLERERRQTRAIQYTAIAIVAIVVLVLGFGYLNMTVLQDRQPVAKVNGDVITTREFQVQTRLARSKIINQYIQNAQFASMLGMQNDASFQQFMQSLQAQLQSPTYIGQQVLDELINDRLIRQEAARRGITVTKEEVDAEIESGLNYFPNGTPTPTVTPTTVVEPTFSPKTLAIITLTPSPTAYPTVTPAPTATPNPDATATPVPAPTLEPTPYTAQGFQEALKKQLDSLKEYNATEKDIRYTIESNLYRQKMMDVITADVPREQDEVWARHILVNDEATAKEVRQKLLDGEDFATLAAEYSQDTGSKDKGGDVGWFGPGKMVLAFEVAAYHLPIGEISQPVKSNFGYHIIQVLAHEVRPLTADEYQQARQDKFDQWLQQQRDASEVETFDYWKDRIPTKPSLDDLANQQQQQQQQIPLQ